VALVKSVGTNAGFVVIEAALYVPFNTWYESKAVTRSGLVAAAAPAVLLRKVANAALFGARMVIFVAFPCVDRRPILT
jgi:hypothetical protein